MSEPNCTLSSISSGGSSSGGSSSEGYRSGDNSVDEVLADLQSKLAAMGKSSIGRAREQLLARNSGGSTTQLMGVIFADLLKKFASSCPDGQVTIFLVFCNF